MRARFGAAQHAGFRHCSVSRAFETFSASETVYNLMNHELVHVVQGDMATEEDTRWRRFFLGKVEAQSKNRNRCSTAT
jgi:hypothetical protein